MWHSAFPSQNNRSDTSCGCHSQVRPAFAPKSARRVVSKIASTVQLVQGRYFGNLAQSDLGHAAPAVHSSGKAGGHPVLRES